VVGPRRRRARRPNREHRESPERSAHDVPPGAGPARAAKDRGAAPRERRRVPPWQGLPCRGGTFPPRRRGRPRPTSPSPLKQPPPRGGPPSPPRRGAPPRLTSPSLLNPLANARNRSACGATSSDGRGGVVGTPLALRPPTAGPGPATKTIRGGSDDEERERAA